MNKNARYISATLALLLAIAACNLPSNAPSTETASTAAASTVQAQLTDVAQTAVSFPTPFSTTTSLPSPTPIPSPIPASATPICDLGKFIADVTIPDGTIMTPGQTFTKTWRIQNIGACNWTGYSLVFDNGDSMGASSSTYPIPTTLTNAFVEIPINLTAPSGPGRHRGYWRIRNSSGALIPIVEGYQGQSFYVDINVQLPVTATNTLPPAAAIATLTSVSSEDGYVSSDGTVNPNPNVGDDSSNNTLETFLSFNMSPIPNGAVITKVVVDFSDYDTLGNPFSISDGCLRAYTQNYGTLDASDFFSGDPLGAVIKWCSTSDLNAVTEDADMINVVQSKVGSSRLQLRLQFRVPTTNGNNVADVVRFGNVKLIVYYH